MMSAAGMSCRSPTVDAQRSPAAVPTTSASGSASAVVSVTATAAPPKLPHEFDRGCVGDIGSGLQPPEALSRIGKSCVPGFVRDQSIATEPIDLLANRPHAWEIMLPAHACVRLGIVSDTAGAVVEVTMKDPSGHSWTPWQRSHVPVLVPKAGPVCTGSAGVYEVEMVARGRGARVWTGLWCTKPPAAAAASSG